MPAFHSAGHRGYERLIAIGRLEIEEGTMSKVIDENREGQFAFDGDRDDAELPEINEEELKNLLRSAPAEQPDAEQPLRKKRPLYKRPVAILIASLLVIAGLIFGTRYYLYASAHESTDDAFIDARIIQISPQVTGHILKVYVSDNQEVKKGDLLAEIDPRDYQARLDQASAALQAAQTKQQAAQINVGLTTTTSSAGVEQAASQVEMAKSGVETARAQVSAAEGRLEQARAQVKTAQANVAQARAQVEAAQAEAVRAQADQVRYQKLYESEDVSRQQLDNAIATARTANAQLEAARTKAAATEAQVAEARAAEGAAEGNLQQARSGITTALAHVGETAGQLAAANSAPQQVAASRSQAQTASADVQQAQANVAQAELNLSYTKIYAPEDGRVARKSIEEGAFVQIGQLLMAVVPDELWVTANFKETQLDNIKPGEPVEIKTDAYPDKVFKGHVDSIQAGTGARFSLLPPENATGNYVKVVQRVPVKIVFDEQPDPSYPLGPGMSVIPEVKIQ